MKVLVVDDEKSLVEMLEKILKQNNIDCDIARNGFDAVEYASCGEYDLIILDIMMPRMDGFETIKQIRKRKIATPVLFLSAKSEVSDKVEGLNLGADDYLTKPFVAAELLARVKALSRRYADYRGDELSFGDLVLDKNTMKLSSKGEVKLGATEYKIMEMLLVNQKSIVQKERLIVKIWGYDSDAEYNNAEVYISFLRKKLQAIQTKVEIKSVRGVGYKLELIDTKQ